MDLKIDFESQLAYQADQSGMTASKQAQSWQRQICQACYSSIWLL
jgi:hypothetical protein